MPTPPIYSVSAECRDCYKCIRHCPVKAIKVVDDHAVVTPELCILCGRCVTTCEHNAKRVRSDLLSVHYRIRRNERPVYASLAPSFVSEFPDVRPAQMVTALKRLGFAGVYETAEGAELVSKRVAEFLDEKDGGVYFSTACPVAVDLVRKYYPELVSSLTPVMPPMMAHVRQLRDRFGNDIDVVFIGPCIAKKRNADESNGELANAMTFEALRRWFKIKRIIPELMEDDPDYKHPGEGASYPIEGGMIRTIETFLSRRDMNGRFMVVSGVGQIMDRLEALSKDMPSGPPVFLEMLACPGGCVAGPKSSVRSKVSSQLDVEMYVAQNPAKSVLETDISAEFCASPVKTEIFPEERITEALHSIGKYRKEDELNCGGCGYESCRAMVQAMLRGDAEPQMCVSHMRQMAQNKSNALSKSMPFGLVIADSDLHIQECNEYFSRLFDESLKLAYEACPGLRGAELDKIIPARALFKKVLLSDGEAVRKNVSIGARIYNITVFGIEKRTSVGALVSEITETEKIRQHMMEKSKEVIMNTTKTVQEIAYMLGKNSAQSELILTSLMDMFKAEPVENLDE